MFSSSLLALQLLANQSTVDKGQDAVDDGQGAVGKAGVLVGTRHVLLVLLNGQGASGQEQDATGDHEDELLWGQKQIYGEYQVRE